VTMSTTRRGGTGRQSRTVLQVGTVDQTHGDVELAVDLPEIVDGYDVGFVQPGGEGGFGAKTGLEHGGRRHAAGSRLRTTTRPREVCKPGRSHPYRRARSAPEADTARTSTPAAGRPHRAAPHMRGWVGGAASAPVSGDRSAAARGAQRRTATGWLRRQTRTSTASRAPVPP
jgi:hypothetical protein